MYKFYFRKSIACAMLMLFAMVAMAQTEIYSNAISTQAEFEALTIIDNNGDNNTWQYNDYGYNAYYKYSKTNAADDWLLTPQLTLQKGVEYTFAFNAKAASSAYPEAFSVLVGKGTDLAAYSVIGENTSFDSPGVALEFTTTVAADGNYRFAIRCQSDADMGTFVVNNLKVTAGVSTSAPAEVTDLVVTPAANGELKATVSFKAPTQTVAGDDLTSLTKIDVYRGETLVKTFENPTPGATLEFVDANAVNGYNTYKVIASNADGEGKDVQAKAFVGQDVPMAPTNLTIKNNGDGTALLSWTAVGNTGVNGGYVNTAAVKYNIYLEGESETDTPQIVKFGVSGTSATINLPTSTEQNIYYYRVTALANSAQSDYALASILLGDPYQLPYEESFAGGVASHFAVGEKVGNNGFAPQTYMDADDDGGSMIASGLQSGEEATLNLGKISLKGAANPILTFSFFSIPGRNAKVNVEIVKPNGNLVPVETIDIASMTGSAGWTEKSVDLAAYNALDYVTLLFHVEANQNNCSFGIDAVSIRDVRAKDMSAEVSAPATVKAGESATIYVTVANLGTNAAESYTMELYINGKMAKMFNGTTLVLNEKKVYDYTFNTKVTDPDNFEIYAVVNYTGDENADNNTSATVNMQLIQPTLPTVSDLAATQTEGGIQLNWTGIETPSETVTEDFESYTDFTITDFGAWNAYDGDNCSTWKPNSYGSFPNAGAPMAYIIYNPSTLGIDLDDDNMSSYVPHSGNKFLASPAANSYSVGNNDFLISEMLSGNAQTVKLYAKSYDASGYYQESFEIRYSTSSNHPDAFTHTALTQTCGTSWKEYTAELPAGARYFAIVNTSYNQMMLQIDDVTYEKGGLNAKSYNIYRDNQLIAKVNAPVVTFTDDEATEGNHVYNVTAVYTDGESSLSNAASIVVTGIDGVAADANTILDAQHFDLSGRHVEPAAKGIHLVKMADGTVKKIVIK